MPGFDQTGPVGYGPGTGRGMGPCGAGMAFGRGGRMGMGGRMGGMRRGFGRGYCWNVSSAVPLSAEEQKQLLDAELSRLEAEKAEIQRRLNDLV